jgi:hypothetical protein
LTATGGGRSTGPRNAHVEPTLFVQTAHPMVTSTTLRTTISLKAGCLTSAWNGLASQIEQTPATR